MQIADINSQIIDICTLNIGGTPIVEVAYEGGYKGYYKDQEEYHLAYSIEIEGEVPVASFDMGHSKILRVLQSKKGANVYIAERTKKAWEFNLVDAEKELKRGITHIDFAKDTLVIATILDKDFDPKTQLKFFELRGRKLKLRSKINYYGVSSCITHHGNQVLLGTKGGQVILYEVTGSSFKSQKTFKAIAKVKLKGSIEDSVFLKKDLVVVGTSTGVLHIISFKKKKEPEITELTIQEAWGERRRVTGKITKVIDTTKVRNTSIIVLATTAEIHEYDGKKEGTGSVIEIHERGESQFELNFVQIPIDLAVVFGRDLVYTEVRSTKIFAMQYFE